MKGTIRMKKMTMAFIINSTEFSLNSRINDVHVAFIENELFVTLKKEIE